MAKTKTSKSISVINRRADLILNLYGRYSDEYSLITAQMSRYDISINENTGAVHIRDTKENRRNYRQLNAWAKRIKKRPAAVEKRRAAKIKEQYKQAADEYEQETSGKLDLKTYYNWLNTFADYFASCYELSTMQGYTGRDAIANADDLYNDNSYYDETWNMFYSAGAFDEFKETAENYDEQATAQKYGIDPETGEIIENTDFFS